MSDSKKSDAQKKEISPEVYQQLKQIAERVYRKRGFGHHTIQPTVLLHEAWMKVSTSTTTYNSRSHFLAVAARAMRQIIIDRARIQNAQKRGGPDQKRTTLAGLAGDSGQVVDAISLHEALNDLEEINARAAEMVMLRTFGGMLVSEIAEAMDVSKRTVDRNLRFAKAFLADRLKAE
ncbi:MAG: ECF-type sigma factor [Myxococcota bacterium]